MIRINLLPYRVARRQTQILQHLTVGLSALGVAAVLMLGAHWLATSELGDLQEEVARLQSENAALMKRIGKIKDLDKLRADVESKLKLVDELQKGRFRSLNTLNGIAQLIPENVWLTDIEDKGTELRLSGFAESNEAVANFMRKLEASPLFANVRLLVIKRQNIREVAVRNFDLSIVRVDEQAEAAKGDTKAAGQRKPS